MTKMVDEMVDENRHKFFERLQRQNKRLTNSIDKLLSKKNKNKTWILINKLIENELEQEELCG